MAPEQIERGIVDKRSDLYSLGVVLYEGLTGELPLGRFPLPSEIMDLDPAIDAVVLSALDKDPLPVSELAHRVRASTAEMAGLIREVGSVLKGAFRLYPLKGGARHVPLDEAFDASGNLGDEGYTAIGVFPRERSRVARYIVESLEKNA